MNTPEKLHPEEVERLGVYALDLALNHLEKHWFDQGVGIVAATIVDCDDSISATSTFDPSSGRWQHAEFNALMTYASEFASFPTPRAVMGVTLSPCFLPSATRVGESCTHHLEETFLHRFVYGHLDEKQTPVAKIYQSRGLEAIYTPNQRQQRICAQLAEFFKLQSTFALSDPNRWNYLKRVMNLNPFELK